MQTKQEWKELNREDRGSLIAQDFKIIQNDKGWLVPSQSGYGKYLVRRRTILSQPECNCIDFVLRKQPCKHIHAVENLLRKDTEIALAEPPHKKTYSQNWQAYNTAQLNEQAYFEILLKDLLNPINENEHRGRGRPKQILRDALFCAIQKVYSQLSLRRAYSSHRSAEFKHYIGHTPHFNATSKLLNKKKITPILNELLMFSALPFRDVETIFIPDSSGFRTTIFNEYCKEKHKTKKEHKWLKAHILVGKTTNVIVTALATKGNTNDCPQFKHLVENAYLNGFNIKEIPADMGYSSRQNYDLAKKIGAIAYIPFKSNATGKADGSYTWSKAFHYFQMNRADFLQHYHSRSNVESTFSMIKAKFGDKLKSKNFIAQQNELLCKLIAHNIVVLIHEMHELGISPIFCADKPINF